MSSQAFESAWFQPISADKTNASVDGRLCQENDSNDGYTQMCAASANKLGNASVVKSPVEVILPRELLFNTDNLLSIIAYSVMFLVAAVGNVTVFFTLFCNRKKKISRISVFIMHLSVADLIVTFIMLPLEIGWHATVAWKAGDTACRILSFFRTFGLYLSSFILIAISLDRYFAITHPLSVADASKRGRIMLVFAWLFGMIASIPQSVIFHLEKHPSHPWFRQCVTFNFFPTEMHAMVYNIFNIFMLYLIPLLVIVVCYSLILHEMSRRSKLRNISDESSSRLGSEASNAECFRRSGVGQMEKARLHTLKMTVVIVVAFIICWTPYFLIMSLWWINEDVAKSIDPMIQRGLFIFAVSNSCMNPIVYGMFTTVFRREVKRRFRICYNRICKTKARHTSRFRQNQFELYYCQIRGKAAAPCKS